MEFSTKDIVEFIKKIPETVIAYQIKKIIQYIPSIIRRRSRSCVGLAMRNTEN